MKKIIYFVLIVSLCLCALMLTSCRKSYDITYELNGGVNDPENPEKYREGDSVPLSIPSKDEYMFAGWYMDPQFENEISRINAADDDIVLYAKWITLEEALEFTEVEGGYRLEKCKSEEHTVAIPELYNGLPVVEIGKSAFYKLDNIKHLYIPSTVEIIEVYEHSYMRMFYSSSRTIEEITVDEDNPFYKSIDGIMYSKDGKTLVCYPSGRKDTEFFVPTEVTAIGNLAFCGNIYLENVILTNNIKSLGHGALSGCIKLKEIDLPESITAIGNGVFSSCSSLEEIKIPDTVTEIGNDVFSSCKNLKKVTLPNGIEKINNNLFRSCTSLESITIPEGVTAIGEYVFKYCSALKDVTLPSTLKSIGKGAFFKCTGLTDITVPDGVVSIDEGAFSNCEKLESVTLSSTLESLGGKAFYKCKSLSEIDLPDSLISIGKSVFDGCYTMEKLDIPNKVTSPLYDIIYDSLFLRELKIGAGVSEITPEALDLLHRNYLEKITVDEGNKHFKSVDGVLYSKDGKTLICYPAKKQGTSYTVPDGVAVIGYSAFSGCYDLVSITIPSSVTLIEDRAFDRCMSLKEIKLPDTVKSIGEDTFNSCLSLEKITVPSALEFLGKTAFSGCQSITRLDLPDNLTYVGPYAFWECINLTSIYIPSKVTEIGEGAFSNAPNTIVYCEAESKPSGWHDNWDGDAKEVIWGYEENDNT